MDDKRSSVTIDLSDGNAIINKKNTLMYTTWINFLKRLDSDRFSTKENLSWQLGMILFSY